MKQILLVAVSIIMTLCLSAQKIRYGISAGINTGYILLKDGLDESGGNATGFQGGAMLQIPINKNIGIMPQLLYVRRQGTVYNFRFDQRNIELPVSIVYTHNNFYIGGGAGIAYGLSANSIMKDGGDYSKVDLYQEGNDFLLLKRTTFTLNTIMGYRFPGGFSMNAGFSPVLGNIRDDEADNSIRSKMFSFSLGYMFP
ncbi:MAG: outer membrane beta-barrel protein [Chitinophagaceae bacterium]|nr:outer membrane beta-barrel protein [Chitinophagaceae bacterium]